MAAPSGTPAMRSDFMDRPLVSILIPTYQHAGFIGAALDSVLGQTYPNCQIIVADDGSTDGTWETIQSYALRYPGRLTVLPQKENNGIDGIIINARRGFPLCRGKYFCFLEGDDVYLPQKIERQVAWMEADDRRVLCGHDTEVFDSDTGSHLYYVSDHHSLPSGVGPERFVLNLPFLTVSIMVRASAMPPHGPDPRLKIAGDWMFFFECLANGGSFGYIDGVHARYRRHANNVTSRFHEVHFTDHMTTLELMEARCPHLSAACRESRASILARRGVFFLRQGDITAARSYLWRSLQQRLRLKPLAAAILALLPSGTGPPIARWYGKR
jgi:glycosyltransferase involved in cell wall biosynthesis